MGRACASVGLRAHHVSLRQPLTAPAPPCPTPPRVAFTGIRVGRCPVSLGRHNRAAPPAWPGSRTRTGAAVAGRAGARRLGEAIVRSAIRRGKEQGVVDAAAKRARLGSLAVLIRLGCTVKRSTRPLYGVAVDVARALRTDTDPASLMRRFRLSPQRLASICIRISSTMRD